MLKHLKLENFRNHQHLELTLEPITILVGKNGAGKSNIIEAVSVLSFCRPFREINKQDLINFSSQFARVSGDDQEIFLSRLPRFFMKAKSKGTSCRLSDFIGHTPVVVFSPETLSILSGSPGDRRRFLDIMISQVDKEYLRALVDYDKVKKQRNHLLKRLKRGEGSISELSYWNKELVSQGALIAIKRDDAISFINNRIVAIYRLISEQEGAEISITYQKNYSNFLEDLESARNQDIAIERTTHGPHRDDLLTSLNQREMSKFSSRGEMKSAVLALKIVELQYLELHQDKYSTAREKKEPMLLLDDVFSEFDASRRRQLTGLISKYQSIITTAEESLLDPELVKKAKVIRFK
ncbi:MAG: DNA replication and repair protein RecF [Patescibacteria group bacterium]|jgi:DNA replication and repair protein RecF